MIIMMMIIMMIMMILMMTISILVSILMMMIGVIVVDGRIPVHCAIHQMFHLKLYDCMLINDNGGGDDSND